MDSLRRRGTLSRMLTPQFDEVKVPQDDQLEVHEAALPLVLAHLMASLISFLFGRLTATWIPGKLIYPVFLVAWIWVGVRFGGRLREFVRQLNKIQQKWQEQQEELQRMERSNSIASVKTPSSHKSAIGEAIAQAKQQSIERSLSQEIGTDLSPSETTAVQAVPDPLPTPEPSIEPASRRQSVRPKHVELSDLLDVLDDVPPPSLPSPNIEPPEFLTPTNFETQDKFSSFGSTLTEDAQEDHPDIHVMGKRGSIPVSPTDSDYSQFTNSTSSITTPTSAFVDQNKDFGDVVLKAMSRDMGVLPRTSSVRKNPADAVRKVFEKKKEEAIQDSGKLAVPESLNSVALIEDPWDGSNFIHTTLKDERRTSLLSVGERRASIVNMNMERRGSMMERRGSVFRSKSADPAQPLHSSGRRGTLASLRPMPSPYVDQNVLHRLGEDNLNMLLTMVSSRGYVAFSIIEAVLTEARSNHPNPYVKLQKWPLAALNVNQRGVFQSFVKFDSDEEASRGHRRSPSNSKTSKSPKIPKGMQPHTCFRTPNRRSVNPVYNQDHCLTLLLGEGEPCMVRLVVKDEKTVLGGSIELGYVDIDYRGIMASGAGEWNVEEDDFVTTMDQPDMIHVFATQQQNLLALSAANSALNLPNKPTKQIVWVCDRWFRTTSGTAEVRMVVEFYLNGQCPTAPPLPTSFHLLSAGAGGLAPAGFGFK